MGSIHACSRPSISRYSALAAALDPNNRRGRLSVGIKADVIGRVAVEVRRGPLADKRNAAVVVNSFCADSPLAVSSKFAVFETRYAFPRLSCPWMPWKLTWPERVSCPFEVKVWCTTKCAVPCQETLSPLHGLRTVPETGIPMLTADDVAGA